MTQKTPELYYIYRIVGRVREYLYVQNSDAYDWVDQSNATPLTSEEVYEWEGFFGSYNQKIIVEK